MRCEFISQYCLQHSICRPSINSYRLWPQELINLLCKQARLKKLKHESDNWKSHRSHVIRYIREKNMLPVNLWVTVLDIDCRLQRVAQFEREFLESICSEIRLSPRYSRDFSISLDCRGFVFFVRIFSHSPHIGNSSRTTNIHKRLVHKPINLLITYIFTALRYFYAITSWRCVNKFSLRVTTLNSSLVRVAYENHDN